MMVLPYLADLWLPLQNMLHVVPPVSQAFIDAIPVILVALQFCQVGTI